eukprot:5594610-Alexandrium_andersonii.AAC.1
MPIPTELAGSAWPLYSLTDHMEHWDPAEHEIPVQDLMCPLGVDCALHNAHSVPPGGGPW